MTDLVVDHFTDFSPGTTASGTWVKLARPQMHCEGWGERSKWREAGENCGGGTGVFVTARARWIRWDGVLQCGTCHRLDVARIEQR